MIIAHRGGVISPETPENTLGAIRLAAQCGYDMVELDVRETRDHVPVLYHGFAGRDHLYIDCGVDQFLEDLTSEELSSISYRMSSEQIPPLSEALTLCANLQLGVMLDIKIPSPSQVCLATISESVTRNGLEFSTVTLGVSRETEVILGGKAVFPLREAYFLRVLAGETLDLGGRYHFEWGSKITAEGVRRIQACGAFVIAAINSFHYPRHARIPLAGEDIKRLFAAGVDGFQIDNEFQDLIPKWQA